MIDQAEIVRTPATAGRSTSAATAAPRTRAPGLWSEIPGSTAAAVFGAWVVATVFLSSISPLPSDDPQSPLVVTLNAAFNIGFFGVLFAAVSRRRIIYIASGLAGGAAAIMATMCGLDGHSGLWIPAQGLIGAAFLVHAVRSLRI